MHEKYWTEVLWLQVNGFRLPTLLTKRRDLLYNSRMVDLHKRNEVVILF